MLAKQHNSYKIKKSSGVVFILGLIHCCGNQHHYSLFQYEDLVLFFPKPFGWCFPQPQMLSLYTCTDQDVAGYSRWVFCRCSGFVLCVCATLFSLILWSTYDCGLVPLWTLVPISSTKGFLVKVRLGLGSPFLLSVK